MDEDCSGADLECPATCECEDADGDDFYPIGCQDEDCIPRTDCNDNNPQVNPGRGELCGNGLDDDCSGDDAACPCSCIDADRDGYYSTACRDVNCDLRTDCDDSHAGVNPGRPETCGNNFDEDCDGVAQGCPCDCVDADGDSYFPQGCGDADCPRRGDCDDTNPLVSPARTEVCGNDVDEDCDGDVQACVPVQVYRVSVRDANPAPDEIICVSFYVPNQGWQIAARSGNSHTADFALPSPGTMEFVVFAAGAGGCDQWRRDLWPSGFDIRVDDVSVTGCIARSASPDPSWNSMRVQVLQDGRVVDDSDPGRPCHYVPARPGFGTRFEVESVAPGPQQTICVGISSPLPGGHQMFPADDVYATELAVRGQHEIEFVVYEGGSQCNWVRDLWPTEHRIRVNGSEIRQCALRIGEPHSRSLRVDLGPPTQDRGQLFCPSLPGICSPFSVWLQPEDGLGLGGVIEWWPAVGDAVRLPVLQEGGWVHSLPGSCAATVDDVVQLDHRRSWAVGSRFGETALCTLTAGGVGIAHDGCR